jgi:hypothetical protein
MISIFEAKFYPLIKGLKNSQKGEGPVRLYLLLLRARPKTEDKLLEVRRDKVKLGLQKRESV